MSSLKFQSQLEYNASFFLKVLKNALQGEDWLLYLALFHAGFYHLRNLMRNYPYLLWVLYWTITSKYHVISSISIDMHLLQFLFSFKETTCCEGIIFMLAFNTELRCYYNNNFFLRKHPAQLSFEGCKNNNIS